MNEEQLKLLKELCDIPVKTWYIADRMGIPEDRVKSLMKKHGIENKMVTKKKKYSHYNHPNTKYPEGARVISGNKEKIKINGKWQHLRHLSKEEVERRKLEKKSRS